MNHTLGGYQLWPIVLGALALALYFAPIVLVLGLALLLGWRERAQLPKARCVCPLIESDDSLTEFAFSKPRWEE